MSTTETSALLQRGIAASRAGRSQEARRLLDQVVRREPHNEMAWLWLSGLMATREQKRVCLEKVLQANPENAYARAGLKRLQEASWPKPASTEASFLETRLATAVGCSDSKQAARNGNGHTPKSSQKKPKLKRLGSPPVSNQPVKEPPQDPPPTEASFSVPTPTDVNRFMTICPACDQPVAVEASRCPHCYIPFHSLDELLGRDKQPPPPPPSSPSPPSKQSRKGILGFLGSILTL